MRGVRGSGLPEIRLSGGIYSLNTNTVLLWGIYALNISPPITAAPITTRYYCPCDVYKMIRYILIEDTSCYILSLSLSLSLLLYCLSAYHRSIRRVANIAHHDGCLPDAPHLKALGLDEWLLLLLQDYSNAQRRVIIETVSRFSSSISPNYVVTMYCSDLPHHPEGEHYH